MVRPYNLTVKGHFLQAVNIQPEGFNIVPTGVNVQPQGANIGPNLIVIGPYDTTVAGQVRLAAYPPAVKSLLCSQHQVISTSSRHCSVPLLCTCARQEL